MAAPGLSAIHENDLPLNRAGKHTRRIAAEAAALLSGTLPEGVFSDNLNGYVLG